ncbi:MAG: XRE family transcriptional regulator [Proteobacteria bacterium]|nr:XRE family transcriptional regulator [Pseudomonadota bacterium]
MTEEKQAPNAGATEEAVAADHLHRAPAPAERTERETEKGPDERMNEKVGQRIRALRKDRGWTVVKMSERTGVARSTLTKLETGQMSPTIGLLQKIAAGLELNLTDLLDDRPGGGQGGRRAITRLGKGEFLEHDGRIHEVLCGELSNKKIVPFRSTIPAQSEQGIQRWYQHDGEEFIYVLAGTIVLKSKLYAPVELTAGDSVYFDANLDHIVVNPTEEPARVLWMISN